MSKPICVPTLNDVGKAFSVSRETVKAWRKSGMPPRERQGWSLGATSAWLRSPGGPWRPTRGAGPDDALSEYRRYRVELLKYELATKAGDLLPKELIHRGMLRLIRILRQCGESLQREFPGAERTLNEALEDFERELDHMFDTDKEQTQ